MVRIFAKFLTYLTMAVFAIEPLSVPAGGQMPPASPTKTLDQVSISSFIRGEMAQQKIPALSVAIVRDGKILEEEGFGSADEKHHVKATPFTPFYIASVTKALTGASLILLQSEGKLDINKPVNDYLRSAKVHSPRWNAADATVLRLADHTGGLTTYERKCPLDDGACKASTQMAIAHYGIIFWPPGDHFDYSNLGYGVLGQVVADVSDVSFSQFLEHHLFRPLAMRDCYLPANGMLRPGSAVNYDQMTHRQTALLVSDTPAASSVRCSSHDLAYFGSFVMGVPVAGQQRILSDKYLNELLYSDDASAGANYSLGWDKNIIDGHVGLFAQGGTGDSMALLQIIPSEKLAIAVVANTGTLLPFEIVKREVAQLLPAGLETSPKESTATFASSPMLSGRWVGTVKTWNGDLPITLEISSGKEVHVAIGEGDTDVVPCTKPEVSSMRLDCIASGNLHIPKRPNGLYPIELELYLHSDALIGAATTNNGAELPSWVELKRASTH